MPGVRVLMWHGFGERTDAQDPYHLFVTPDAFRAQLAHLAARGARFLDTDAFMAGLETGEWPERSVLLTIDDGYASTLHVAAPILKEYHAPALLFVPAGEVGSTSDWMSEMPDEPLLTADELRELPAYGIEVGVHGMEHQRMPGMTADELRRNVDEARDLIASITGTVPRTFAYPEGFFDDAARAAVERAGFVCAFSVHRADGRYAVPRVDVNGTDTARTFGFKVSPWWPLAARVAAKTPRLRAALHRVVGSARR